MAPGRRILLFVLTAALPILHDIDAASNPMMSSPGLFAANGVAYPPVPVQAVPATLAANKAFAIGEPPRKDPADKFTIYSSTISGEDRTLIVSDPRREMNHARVSADLKWVVFTRYNRFNKDGEALEVTSYLETEVVLCRIDGSDCDVIIPPRKGIVSANAYWTPSDKGILFVTNDTPSKSAGIKLFDLATRDISIFYLADDVLVADPHMVGQTVVMPGKLKADPYLSRLYLVDATTKSRRQVTDPKFATFKKMEPPLGDHDPKLSPDGRMVAVMRHMAQDDWSIVVVDVATGAEKELSEPHAVDAVPEWSSDGKLLVFWSVVRNNLKASGLYTIRPDGTDRGRVDLPSGFFYQMPAFFPGGGSDSTSKIIYSAKVDPKL